MAISAVARETVFALRRQIAKIEGTLPERLQAPAGAPLDADASPDLTIVRRGLAAALPDAFLPIGVETLCRFTSGVPPYASDRKRLSSYWQVA